MRGWLRSKTRARTRTGSCVSIPKPLSSGSTASSRCETRNNSSWRSSDSTRRSSCWRRRMETNTKAWVVRWSSCPTFLPASSQLSTCRSRAESRSTSSSARESMQSSSARETSPSSSVTARRRSSFTRGVDRWAESQWGGRGTALLAILGGAAALRFVGIQYGLPFGNLLNPDEESIVPRAWKLVHGGGGDPHWFDYPSLLMYVNAPFQWWQDEPSYLTARIVGVVLGLAAIAATWWLGRRAFGTSAAAVAAASTAACSFHVAYLGAAVI